MNLVRQHTRRVCWWPKDAASLLGAAFLFTPLQAMRYSIIHHDVKEKFQLTVAEYLVCDSIHQLSHRRPYIGTLKNIEDFLGVNRQTLWRARTKLISIGLLEIVGDGVTTSEAWFKAVTEASEGNKMLHKKGQNVTSTQQNVTFSPLYKEDKETITVVAERDEESPKPSRKKKTTPEMEEVFAIFTDNPARVQWRMFESERVAAEVLHKEFGIESLTKRYRAAKKYEGEEGCPFISTPSTLLGKMKMLDNFMRKNIV